MKHTILTICALIISPCKCVAFLSSTTTRQAEVCASKSHHRSLLKVASTSSIVASMNTKETSDELVSLLIKRRRGRSNGDDEERISYLVSTLTSAGVRFDPALCLDGPLFVSNVVEGPPPLWERFGIKLVGGDSGESVRNVGNIQGQQYVYRDNEKSVTNYAEILGKQFHVRAYGTYERDAEDNGNTDGSIQQQNGSPLDSVLAFLGSGESDSKGRSGMIQCPADFTVKVSKGSFFVLGRRFDIPIAGTGYLRVLYADEHLRIFVSPKSTTDDRWEKAGLKVAQVNINCFLLGGDGEFEDLCSSGQ